jgi:hypothetical protein
MIFRIWHGWTTPENSDISLYLESADSWFYGKILSYNGYLLIEHELPAKQGLFFYSQKFCGAG